MTVLRPRVAVTFGDPAGVGPEVIARALARPGVLERADVSILADASEVRDAFGQADLPVPGIAPGHRPGFATLLEDGTAPNPPIPLAQVGREAGARAMHQLERALALANDRQVDAIVFGPLNKTSLHLAGMREHDELRWFAGRLGYQGTTSELNVMEGLWTARVTSHLPMADVAAGITTESVLGAIELLARVLDEAGIDPRIGVAALNPHAGENGNFGREEIDRIAPAVALAQQRGIAVRGPFPADTIFLAARRGDFNGVLTMYHDQGQIAMKLLGFDGGVTIEGGLPVVITTPAHGTAFDLVGRRKATITSTANAFDIAVEIASRAPRR